MRYPGLSFDVDDLIQKLLCASDPEEKLLLIRKLEDAADRRAIPVLISTIREERRFNVRFCAARALGALISPEELFETLSRLPAVVYDLREEIVKVMARRYGFKALRVLVSCLDPRSFRVHGVAWNALVELKERDAARLQKELTFMALGDDDERMRVLATKALGELHFPRGNKTLLLLAHTDDSVQVRSAALKSIPGAVNQQTLQALLDFAASTDQDLRPLSLALGKLATRFHRARALIGLLPRLDVQEVVRGVLEEVRHPEEVDAERRALLLLLIEHPEIKTTSFRDQIARLLASRERTRDLS